jgi:DNA-binding winged helix-turn-helix (wHTH) protein
MLRFGARRGVTSVAKSTGVHLSSGRRWGNFQWSPGFAGRFGALGPTFFRLLAPTPMNAQEKRLALAQEPDFQIGQLRVSPSACRIFAGADEVRVEAQTMAVLVVLARAGGATVTRDDLIEACWQGRIVTDDAITRTIAKVRGLARYVTPAPFVLETVPKVGYRLIAQSAAGVAAPDARAPEPAASAGSDRLRRWRPLAIAAGVALAIPVAWSMLPREGASRPPEGAGPAAAGPAATGLPSAQEVSEALVLLDKDRVLDYLKRGWNPNWKLDAEGGDALQTLLLACERNPTHDRGMVAQIARELILAGDDPSMTNKWGDNSLDIANSVRYCGPKHPVTEFLRSMTKPAQPS